MRDQTLDHVAGLLVRGLIVAIAAKELIAPDRHVAGTVRRTSRLTVDAPVNLLCRKLPAISCRNQCEIRYVGLDKGRDRTIAKSPQAMAAGAEHFIQSGTGIIFRSLQMLHRSARQYGACQGYQAQPTEN